VVRIDEDKKDMDQSVEKETLKIVYYRSRLILLM